MTGKLRIALIGASGQLGQELRRSLRAAGHHVLIPERVRYDLAVAGTLAATLREMAPQLVVNAAAYTAVDRAEDEPERAHAINAQAAGEMATIAAQLEAPIVHISTDYVFDGAKGSPYTEDDPPKPLGVYGASKLAGEYEVAAANPRHIILRTAWVFSPHASNFVKTILRLAAERPALKVVADQMGCPTSTADLADAITDIVARCVEAEAGSPLFGTFHAVNAGSATWCDFARAIMDGAARRGAPHVSVEAIPSSGYPTRARRPADTRLATAKLAAVHGLELPSWIDALETTLDALLGPRANAVSTPGACDRARLAG
jgi:dTDP-4-dehydrorhamnose reductase